MLILVFGFLFGAILQYASLNKYNVISGLARLENLAVAKAIVLSIGVGVILLNIEVGLGLTDYHIKPLLLGGVVFGGLVFGTGMAILGYCPGTLAISMGEGSLDAVIGIIGGLTGGLVFTILQPNLKVFLGPNLGAISLNSIVGTNSIFYVLIFIIGTLFIVLSFWIDKKDKVKGKKWLVSGVALAILNTLVFLIFNRPIGASTAFPYVADLLSGFTSNIYFFKIKTPGSWELLFLSGAFISSLVVSLFKKNFKITLIYSSWEKFKGNSVFKRVFWSFVGGFILVFGARMAGGCTSGHILSGGMQLAASSLLFAVFTFVGLLVTGKLFYKKR